MSESKFKATKNELARALGLGGRRIHFIGVLGVSMSSLAAWCIERGHFVSGSDLRFDDGESPPPGVEMCREGDFGYIRDADLVVYSLAIPESDKERAYAKEHSIPELSRAEMLGAIMQEYKIRIGISGTHGKSTTSSIIYHVLKSVGKNPTAMIGAKFNDGKCYDLGGEEYFIYEACEYRDAFLQFTPDYAIITSVELDHTDYFRDVSALRASFSESVSGADRIYLSSDVENYRELCGARGIIPYGAECRDGFVYRIESVDICGSHFSVYRRGEAIGGFYLPVPGEFNIKNAVAAIALLTDLGIEACQINRALSTFSTVSGRLEYIGSLGRRRVYLDYAHHPTAVKETLRLLKSLSDYVTVVFRPHTYTRTRDFASEFAHALSIADYVAITDIYPAREEPIPGVDAPWLASMIEGGVYLSEEDAAEWTLSSTRGVIILMGAGDLSIVKEMIFKLYQE